MGVTDQAQVALAALNRQFGKDLYLAKFDTACSAFKALKEVPAPEQKPLVLGSHLAEWMNRCAVAVRIWTPKYVAMASAFGTTSADKWEWVKEKVTQVLGGRTWDSLNWWIRNACNQAPEFGLALARKGPWLAPEWLRPTTTSDPIGYYRMRLRAEIGREVDYAIDNAKIEATTRPTDSSVAQPAPDHVVPLGLSTLPCSPDGKLSLGRWADELLPQGALVAKQIRSNVPEDQLRSRFPAFFKQVLDELYSEKKQHFFRDARGRKLNNPELLQIMAEVKGITGPTLSSYRKKYRQTKGS